MQILKRAGINILLPIIMVFTFTLCNNNKLSYHEARTLLLKNMYPQKIKVPFNLIVRYESKEDPKKWEEQAWKKNNNALEKSGLLRQVLVDSSLEFYIQNEARFEKKHQYVYKTILTKDLRQLMTNPVLRNNNFDEWDYYNRHTGRKDWYECDAVCGELKLDTILDIDQMKGPLDVYIKYKEKFNASAFNDIAFYGKRYTKDETIIKTATARKYQGEEWKIVF